MRLPRIVPTVLLSTTLLLAGCGGEVKIAAGAVDEVAAAFGRSTGATIEASAEDVSRLAKQAGVTEDVIRDVAPRLDTQSTWRKTLVEAKTFYNQTPEQVRDILLDVACDAVNGKISDQEQLAEAVRDQIKGLSQDELAGLVKDVFELWTGLYEAMTSDIPAVKAAAVLTCFTLKTVS